MASSASKKRRERVDKELARHDPRPGDSLLFYHAEWESLLITWFTRSRFYHVGIYAGDGEVIEARPRGVVRRSLYGNDGGYWFVVIPAPGDTGDAALAWAQTKIGDGYDLVSVAAIVLDGIFTHLKLNLSLPNRYSCGEFVAAAFEHAGAPLFPDLDPARVTPADFERFVSPESLPSRRD